MDILEVEGVSRRSVLDAEGLDSRVVLFGDEDKGRAVVEPNLGGDEGPSTC